MYKITMDFEQLDNSGIIYFPCKGKIPSVKEWQKLTTSKKVKEKSNYGVLCGKVSGITIIDIDNKSDAMIKNGVDIWNLLLKQFNDGTALETPTVKTGSSGLHIYFKYNASLKTGTHCIKGYDSSGFKITYAVDVRNDGGYCVSDGSVHPDTKKKYRYVKDFMDCNLIEMPDWLVKAFKMDINLDIGNKITFTAREKPIKTPEIIESPEETPNISIELFRQIIVALSPQRAHSYDSWLKVCFAVGGIDKRFGWNNIDTLNEFASKANNYNECETEKRYEEGDGTIGLGSMWHWLKEDDPAKFKELYDKFRQEAGSKCFYYGDYKKLVGLHSERGFLYINEVKEYLKGAFVKIDNGGNTRWLSRNRDTDGTDIWELMHTMPFSDNKIDMFLPSSEKEEKEEKKKKTSFYAILKAFSVHPDFPIYDKLDFRPYLREDEKQYRDGEVFNLFKGFPHNPDGPYDEKVIEPILQCMRDVISGGNEEFFNYYLRYIAHAIQYPDEKPGVAIIIISKPGLGKDLIHFDFLQRVFGHRLLHRVNDLSEITRKFNKKLEGKLMTIVGEIRSFNNELDTEKLKGVITDNTLNIEPKGKDPYEIRDRQRFVCHTNNMIPIGTTEDDRRLLIHKVGKEFIQSREYYNNLVQIVHNPETAVHFFKFLAQMDLSDFDIRERPITVAKQDLVILTAPNVFRFMADVCTKNWQLSDAKIKGDEIKIHSRHLYDNYARWITENGEKSKHSLKIFKQKLEECGLVEHDKQFKLLNSAKANGYKTTFTHMNKCFKAYIQEKKISSDDEDGDSSSDEE